MVHDEAATATHVRAAAGGNQQSLAWTIAHLTPWLLAQAKWRLARFPRLNGIYAAEDVAQDTWMVTLRKLPELRLDPERPSRTLLAFLATTLSHRISDLWDKHYRNKRQVVSLQSPSSGTGGSGLLALSDAVTGAVTKAMRKERSCAIAEALKSLSESDQSMIMLKGLEGLSNIEIAAIENITAKNVSVRYVRAIQKLRVVLPGAAFDEFLEPASISDSADLRKP